jgi:hypothetical protein
MRQCSTGPFCRSIHISLLSCYSTVFLFHHIRLFLNLPSHKAHRLITQALSPSNPNHWRTRIDRLQSPISSSPLRHSPWVSRHYGQQSNVPVSATHPILENKLIGFVTTATQPRPCGQHTMKHLVTSIPFTTLITTSFRVRVRANHLHHHPASTLQSTRS